MTIVADEERTPPRRILPVVTVGRQTCSAPMLEICRILHTRGHTVEFACLDGWQHLAKPHDFVQAIHVIGRDLTHEEDVELYRLFDASDMDSAAGRKGTIRALMFFNRWWPETYRGLKALCEQQRFDMIYGYIMADRCIEVMQEFHIPLATQYPQMSIFMAPQSYIPGIPGMQRMHLTSEHASIGRRIAEELRRFQFAFAAKDLIMQKQRHRKEAGLPRSGPPPAKPNYLVFVNSFFGVEVPKDLPPLIAPVGPVLAETFPALHHSSELGQYLDSRSRIIYVAFGSHVNLPLWRIERLITGLADAIAQGHLNGVVWAMKNLDEVKVQCTADSSESKSAFEQPVLNLQNILGNADDRFRFLKWVPQRAILSHTSIKIYLSHCGASSTMEAVYHGVPVLAMPIYMDQLGNGKRLVDAGVGIETDRHRFTSADISQSVKALI